MRKLWLRLWLWWNNVCPEHGPMDYGIRSYYCKPCHLRTWGLYHQEIKDKMEEYAKQV